MINRLFLPISYETVELVLEESVFYDGDDLNLSVLNSNKFHSLSLYELAALYVINQLPSLIPPNNLRLEKVLHEIINIGQEYESQSEKKFVHEIKDRFSTASIRKGRDLAKENEIYLLPENDVRHSKYLTAEGRWDYEFKTNYKHPDIQEKVIIALPSGHQREMFSNQHRIFSQIERSLSDEHIDVQGYAGTGKTHMLSAISEIMVSRNKNNSKRILALTHSRVQLDALRAVLHPSVQPMTFGQLAALMISKEHSQHNIKLNRTSLDREANPINAVATEFHLKSVSTYLPNRVSSIIFQMVARFCSTRDSEITEDLIPRWVSGLSFDDKSYLTSHASLLWEFIMNPPANFPVEVPVRDMHVVKYASLHRYKIPAYFSHLIVDESHDLSEPMLEIIERSNQGYIGLGDKFQTINSITAKRMSPAIERQMNSSIRTPGKLGDIVNFSLDLHSLPVMDEFIANREKSCEIEYYDRPIVPIKPTAIWVDDLWELFEWSERLAALKLPYRVLGSGPQLDQFAQGCIRLYREKKSVRVIGLSNYNDWNDVLNQNSRHRSVAHLTKLFEKGYKTENWQKTKSLQSHSAQYVIGLFQNARNHEFDSVMLAPAIIQQLYDVKRSMSIQSKENKAARSSLASRLYLGVTRSRHRLILPQSFEEFMHFL
ncbi:MULTISPECIES: AAA family ATPase [unclassified Methylophaga]|jgi:hypothetical protein|uniref:AAA family ATPase n=1 Tax=unclassified Methylophaga TaxID=2629249 RepID=UPI000C499F69|nr:MULTISPECIES: AAA family ATPase [unclassified Methylophaga]MAL51017.1 hypothetical protein [Methylophaga sp.]MAM28790.1 hypothetical protein [Flavobacteriaceae bacterium]MBP23907.1 hypothetical protein [Methylophaga sp.]HCC82266.1 hypothetical protein [Methylophaga sp.]|tara:strand:- start:7869 stop:9842 length:1974 start_codon:yes stop_codon:yes gene_type:complete